MTDIAIIGGTGALALLPEEGVSSTVHTTAYGDPSGPVFEWSVAGSRCLFLPRHGLDGTIPPHRVNYRANIQVLKDMCAERVVGINAVGGICAAACPGHLALPDQMIDYTWGREHTFFDATDVAVTHIEFDPPIAPALHARLVYQAGKLGLSCLAGGVYGVTQGPRLETAAEIDRLERDGCDLVGMTAMPEASLAKEAGLDYAVCALVVNHAAGRAPGDAGIHDQMERSIEQAMRQAGRLLEAILSD